jgi:transcriptional regulator with XRE-family HTH domain
VISIRLRVREIAEKQGLDPAKLARKADLGYATVVGIWYDHTRNPGIVTLNKIAGALGVPMEELYTLESGDEETKIQAPA